MNLKWIIIASSLLSALRCNAQSLADVLSSIQERKLVLEQAQGFIKDQANSVPGWYSPGGNSGTFELISWSNSPAFPTDGNLEELGIEERVHLLNEARKHFQIIRAGFVNMAPERLSTGPGSRPPAVIRRHDEMSMPTPPVANHRNFIGVLRELACKVDSLRITPWPVNYTLTTGTINNGTGERPQSSGADKIQWDEINQTTSNNWDFWATELPVRASFRVGGRNYETNTGTPENPVWEPREFRYLQRNWPSDFSLAFSSGTLNLPTGVSEVQGTCVVLAKQENSPYLAAAGTGSSAAPIPARGGFKILTTASSAGTHSLASPEWVVSGTWVASDGGDTDYTRNVHYFEPNSSTSSGYEWSFNSGSQPVYSCILQDIVFLLVPTFTKGLDAGVSSRDYAWDRPFAPGNPGDVSVTGGAAKFTVDAGRGRSMLAAGAIQIQHGWTEFPGFWGQVQMAPAAFPEVLWGHPNGSIEYLDYFTDKANHRRMPLSFGTNLCFVGSERDYEVLYETRFDHGRANLLNWPEDTLVDSTRGWQHGMAYYWEWQKPRLRQVLGREALLDIATGSNDYTHTISVYRIPIGHTITYDSDGFVETAGLAPLKTINIGSAALDQEGFPIDDLSLTVEADGGDWTVQGDGGMDWFGYPVSWEVTLENASNAAVIFEELWTRIVDYAILDPLTEVPVAFEAPVMESFEVIQTRDGVAATEVSTTFDSDSQRSLIADPLPRIMGHSELSGAGTATTDFTYESGANAPDFPTTITSNVPDEPEVIVKLNPSGMPDYIESGSGSSQWKTDWSVNEDGLLIEEHSFGGDVFARDWIKWENDGWTTTVFSAPDGTVNDPETAPVDWRKLETGKFGGNGFTGLPHLLTAKDGSGATWSWTINSDGSSGLDFRQGWMVSGAVTRGSKFLTATNSRGYGTGWEKFLLQSGDPKKIAGASVPTGQLTNWGFPTKMQDFNTGLASLVILDGNRDRLSSKTDSFGVVTTFGGYDALDRPASFTWNGHSGTNDYNNSGFGVSSNLNIDGRSVAHSLAWDAIGRPTGGSATSGRTRSFTLAHAATGKTFSTSETVTGISSVTEMRPNYSGLMQQTATTLGFGGLAGSTLVVDDGSSNPDREGLFRSKTSLGGLSSAFRTTWTDAWGRLRSVVKTGANGSIDDESRILYSPPASTIKGVETRHASGKRFIEEVEPWAANGTITRAGIDKNNSGALDFGDRYVASVTEIVGTTIRTTISQTGNATSLIVRDWNPATGVTTTTLNGGEEVITETPNYSAKTSEIICKRDGVTVSTTNLSLNHLGQPDQTTVGGAGIPTSTINPTFRDDGSVSAISLTIGGATASASFGENGTLSGLIHPVLGNLTATVSHGFANGYENITVNGTTAAAKLDGTTSSLAGAGVMARSRSTEIGDGHFVETINPGDPTQAEDPDDGANTSLISNPAGAKVLHQYAAGANPATSWLPGGLLESVTLGRGGALTFGYSSDGAKDLISINWPEVVSEGFPNESFYGGTVGFTERDDTGNVTELIDPAGERSLAYEKNRLTTTDWLSGELNAYKVVRQHDDRGRLQSVTVHRNGAAIHTAEPSYTGLSDEVSGMVANAFSASVTRDTTNRHVTGFTRGPVTQRWTRGTAGRITAADTDSTVNNAPTFAYTGFDTKGRRKTVNTNKGNWTYGYRADDNGDGQLVSADSSDDDITDFTYNFDGIGRRNFGSNQQDELNRFLAMTHPLVPKRLFLSADPAARLYAAQGVESLTELTPFEGSWIYQINHLDGASGWVPWHVKGVLEYAGDEGAFDHAVAEFSGHLWFPPENETFDFDEDGNRETSSLWNYGWDGRNKLVRARTKTWNTAPKGWDLKFDYDAEGRRFKKTVTRYEDGDPVEHKVIHFIWDGWDLLYERHEDVHGNLLLDRKYVWGPDIADGAAGGAGGLLLFREKRGTTTKDYYPLFDGTGHVTALTDSTGNLVAEYWWGPFGELIEAKGEMADANPFRFATKYFDAETGLYYFGHRYYDPVTGQWLNREPLGEDVSLNLYAYCHNDPINKVDVLGLAPKWMTDEQGKAYDRMLTEMVRAGAHDANTHFTILSMMELDGILHGSGRGDRARMSEYLSQTGSVATDNPILVATIGTAADLGSGIVSAIPGMGPEGDGATDGSNTNGRLLIDTFRANAAGLISLGNFNSPAIQRSMGEFMQGYESKYSYNQRSVAQGLVFVAPFAPKVRPALGALTSRVANLHPVFNPSFAGRPGFASGMVRIPGSGTAKGTPRQTMATGAEWYEHFTGKYGAQNVDWVSGSGRTINWPAELPMPATTSMIRVPPPVRSSTFVRELETVAGPRPPGSIGHHNQPLGLGGIDDGALNGSWQLDTPHTIGHGLLNRLVNVVPYGTQIRIKP